MWTWGGTWTNLSSKTNTICLFSWQKFSSKKNESDFKYNSKLKNMQKMQEFSAFEDILEK